MDYFKTFKKDSAYGKMSMVSLDADRTKAFNEGMFPNSSKEPVSGLTNGKQSSIVLDTERTKNLNNNMFKDKSNASLPKRSITPSIAPPSGTDLYNHTTKITPSYEQNFGTQQEIKPKGSTMVDNKVNQAPKPTPVPEVKVEKPKAPKGRVFTRRNLAFAAAAAGGYLINNAVHKNEN